jgi:drug/metabolite transporter (DMT)-like permease
MSHQRRPGQARTARGEPGSLSPRVWLALAVVYVVWGSTYLGIDLAVRTIPPFLMAAVRFLIAGALLYAWAVRHGDRSDRPTPRHWLSAFLVAVPMLAVGNAAVGWAEHASVDTGTASLIIASVPLWMALLDRFVYGQRLARVAVAGLAVGFAGVGLLVAPGGSGVKPAAIVLVFSSLAWATGSLYSRRAPQPARPLLAAGMQMLAGGLVLIVVAAVTGEFGEVHPAQISLESWLGLVYLVFAGSLLAFTAYMWLLRNAPTALVGTYAYVNPFVAVLLGTLILGEPLGWRTVVGGGVVVAAVALIVRAPRAKPRPAVEARPAAVAARGG